MSGSQPTSFDPRIMQVSFQINDQIKTYDQRFAIRAKGQKFANPLQNQCTVEIANLDKDTRNYLLTVTSPFNTTKTPTIIELKVGRVSTGLFSIYKGEVSSSQITQPPDIFIRLKCGTKHSKRGQVGSRSGSGSQHIGDIARAVAGNMGLSLNNQAKDRIITNYSHNGDAASEVNKLHEMGCDAYVDDDQLVLKERYTMLSGDLLVLNESTGLVGVPEVTEKGLRVRFLWDNSVKLGGGIQVESKLNPSCNGVFVIYKLNFDVTSREVPFYYIAECLKAKT